MKFILGKKLGMTRIFDEGGKAIPVTLVEAGPCTVTQKKEEEKNGYNAVQIGFTELKKPKKAQKEKPFRLLREVRGLFPASPGDKVSVDVFSPGDKVRVGGVSKGKGFAGVVKRWGFKGAATSSHGTKHNERAPGSIGSAFPQRVFKGKKMAGRMGSDKITQKNLQVAAIDKEKNIIAIKGALPGRTGSFITIEGYES